MTDGNIHLGLGYIDGWFRSLPVEHLLRARCGLGWPRQLWANREGCDPAIPVFLDQGVGLARSTGHRHPGAAGEPAPAGAASQLELPSIMEMGEMGEAHQPGAPVVWWSKRCGKGEEAHWLKEDLAGGRLPSGLFGANAAWWAITVLAFNLNSAMKQLALGQEWVSRRLKAVRFGVINLPGRVVRHARTLLINLGQGHPSYPVLVAARRSILALAHGPPL